MWAPYNPNPRGKLVGDCAVRAISKLVNKNWYDTYLDLCLLGMLMGDMPSSNSVTTVYLKSRGFKRSTIPDICPDCYCIADFCNDHPSGSYIVGTGSHLVAIVNGVLWDSWDSSNEYPVYYFEKMED